MAMVGNGGLVQVFTTPKRNAPRPLTFPKARSARAIDNFLWVLKVYFRAMGIKYGAQKESDTTFSLNDIALVW